MADLILKYRAGVGAVLYNDDGNVLVGLRTGIKAKDTWQFPQGGIDTGEATHFAAQREVHEETGILLDSPPALVYPEKLFYDFPNGISETLKVSGQMHHWFFYRWNGDPDHYHKNAIHKEFSRIFFADFREVLDHTVEFKKIVYRKLFDFFKNQIWMELQFDGISK